MQIQQIGVIIGFVYDLRNSDYGCFENCYRIPNIY